jgi:hypothetical protein
MRNLILLAGAATMALAAPVLAKPGGGGGGHGGGNPHAAQGGGQGGGHGGGGNGGGGKANKQGGGNPHAAQGHGGGGFAAAPRAAPQQRQQMGGQHGQAKHEQRQAFRSEPGGRGNGNGKAQKFAAPRQERFAAPRQERFAAPRQERFDDRRQAQQRVYDGPRYQGNDQRYAAGNGCPPGLARKNNGCLPPGQARKAYAVGQRIQPSWFSGYSIPAAYTPLYYDTPDYYYRYDGYGDIYRVDSRTNLISGLIPLLGGGFNVGQPIPAGYDVYNVPYQYRDDYQDNDDYYYRYGDNAIYQVDSGTNMIDGIVALLGGGLNVGQQLPAGYDAYNVPPDYRDEYYDTDEDLYRYADGNIYQVDAQSGLIEAIVQMLT